MALFENFPWTNLHELNLDWLIQELKMVKESAVISVNGETGEVILYQDPDIEFPATDNGGWDMVRKVDGSIAAGIRFTADGIAYLITGAQVRQLYDANHQPPYPVTSVNGQTGEVEIEAPVTSVNGLTGAVVLYSEQFVQLPDLTGEQIANWNFYRRINNVLHGIQFDNDGRAYIMQGMNRYQIYTEHNQQPLNFVDDENAGIMKISTDAPAGVWGLLRETDSGTAGIVFSYDATTPTAYLQYLTQEGGQTVTHNIKLLTPDDIPTSSGVVSLNGLTGVVVINGSNLNYKSGSNFTIEQMIDNINQNIGDLADLDTTVNTSAVDAINEVNGKAEANETAIENVKSTIAIVENGNTATNNISVGQYVIWNNALFTAREAIAIGDTLSYTNLQAVSNGAANSLSQAIANLSPSEYSTTGITASSGVSITQGGYFMIGSICVVMMVLSNTSSIAQYGQLFTGLPKSKGLTGGGNPVNAGTESAALENTSAGVRAFAVSAISANSTIRIFTTYIAE